MVCFRIAISRVSQISILSNSNFPISVFNCNSTSCKTVKTLRLINSSLRFASSTSKLERLYTEKHEWVSVKENIGTVGISDYAQEALGDVVFAQLPENGTNVNKDDEVGALESVKAASELFSPVSGNVVSKNVNVEETPALINQSCYDKGWLFKVELSKHEELLDLMNEEQYMEFLKSGPQH